MRIGTDIIEIRRIKALLQRQPRLPQRILSDEELEIYQTFNSQARQVSFLAGRFSAKEAYGKALGTGVGTQLAFRDISILPGKSGAPVIAQGPVLDPDMIISISHCHDYATATALLTLNDDQLSNAKCQFGLKGDSLC